MEQSSALAERLIGRAGIDGPVRIEPVDGGGNSRVWRIHVPNRAFVLKRYFRHRDEQIDRLLREFSFLRFAWSAGIRCVPEPLAADLEAAAALYSCVAGRHLRPDEVDAVAVDQAVSFVEKLNEQRHTPGAEELADVAEACFSIEEHVGRVDARIARLAEIEPTTPVHFDMQLFVRDEVGPVWRSIRLGAMAHANRIDVGGTSPIGGAERCLSPSDFGFHNALGEDGRITFLDFEYAGWDDPAKTVCDFFCQVAVPVPLNHFDQVAKRLAALTTDPSLHFHRMVTLLPVYQVKWCCILLNAFLPLHRARRSFAVRTAIEADHLAAQLDKARACLARIGSTQGAAARI